MEDREKPPGPDEASKIRRSWNRIYKYWKLKPEYLKKALPGLFKCKAQSQEYSYSRHQNYIFKLRKRSPEYGTKYKTISPTLSLSATSTLLIRRVILSRRLLTNLSSNIPTATKRNPAPATPAAAMSSPSMRATTAYTNRTGAKAVPVIIRLLKRLTRCPPGIPLPTPKRGYLLDDNRLTQVNRAHYIREL